MAANERLRTRGRKRATRTLADFASEIRHARIRSGISQAELGRRLGISADKVWKVEHERQPSLSIVSACEMGAVLGFDFSAKLYPNGASVRDAAQTRRLTRFLAIVGAPLTYRTDAPLPQQSGVVDLRAWDALLSGHDERTGIELESRLTTRRRRSDATTSSDATIRSITSS